MWPSSPPPCVILSTPLSCSGLRQWGCAVHCGARRLRRPSLSNPPPKKGAGVQFPPPFAGPERRRKLYFLILSYKSAWAIYFGRLFEPNGRGGGGGGKEEKIRSVPFRRRRSTPFLIVSLTLCPVFMLVRSVCIFNRSRPSSSFRIRPPQLFDSSSSSTCDWNIVLERQLSLKCPVCPVSNVSQRTDEKRVFS